MGQFPSSPRTARRPWPGFSSMPDVTRILPKEVVLRIFSFLNATDLCVLACVSAPYRHLAEDDGLWRHLCTSDFGVRTNTPRIGDRQWKSVYLVMDEGISLFNVNPPKGLQFLRHQSLLGCGPEETSRLLLSAKRGVSQKTLGKFLGQRPDILSCYMQILNFSNVLLATALRKYFSLVLVPNQQPHRHVLMSHFVQRYVECNQSDFTIDSADILVNALILLSLDHSLCRSGRFVQNRMSKREFIKNTQAALASSNQNRVANDLLVALYDDVYVNGPLLPDYRVPWEIPVFVDDPEDSLVPTPEPIMSIA